MSEHGTNGEEPRFQKLVTRIGGAARELFLARDNGGFVVRSGDRERSVAWHPLGGGRALVEIDGRNHEVHMERIGPSRYLFDWRGRQVVVEVEDELAARAAKAHGAAGKGARGPVTIQSPMPGTVVQLLVEEGAPVEAGQAVLIIEAMKMQNEVASPIKGKMKKISVRAGQAVEARQALCVVAPE